jgi:hypothetical protein
MPDATSRLAEQQAWDAPFPDTGHRAALRAFQAFARRGAAEQGKRG